jgi:hypothetical protein
MAATRRPLSLTAETQVPGAPSWQTIPGWDLITLNDRAILPDGQRFMTRRRMLMSRPSARRTR